VTDSGQRFHIPLTWWILPVLLVMGVLPRRCFLEIFAGSMRVKFGWLFNRTIDMDRVECVRAVRVPWYVGPGVHIDSRWRIFVTGSYGDAVEIVLRPPHSVSFWGLRARRIVVTARPTEAVVTALHRAVR
jgi:hypothetical protein